MGKIQQLTYLTFAILSLTFALFSCGENNESNANLLKDRIEEVQNNDREFTDSPCELISSEDMRQICSVPEEFEITQLAKMYTYPTCKFSWNDGKYQKSYGNNTIAMDNEIMIVMVKDATNQMFDASTKVYKDGIFVEGIGENAKWGQIISQLTFLSRGYMFHVNVKILPDPEENKKIAIDIARFLMGKI